MRIEASDICYSAGDLPILRSVDVAFKPGELVGLIGPNGAGKSTLLKILAGLLAPDEGGLSYDERPVSDISHSERARLVSFLPQDGRAEWPISVRDLVGLGRLPHRGLIASRSREVDEAAVDRAMAAAGIEAFAKRDATRLSGGELARVLLARALAVEAPMLLADEPVSQLDPFHQLQIVSLLRDLARGGRGVVLVLHDLSLAARFCDRLVLMKEGRILAAGEPAAVTGDRELAEAYGVEVVRGLHQDQPFLLPWSAVRRSALDPLHLASGKQPG